MTAGSSIRTLWDGSDLRPGLFDPALKATRKQVLIFLARPSVMIFIIIFTLVALYWGSQYNPEYSNFGVALVDLDGGEIGQLVLGFQNQSLPVANVGFQVSPQYTSIQDVLDAVQNEDVWCAVVANRNATANLYGALSQGNSAYNPTTAITIIVNTARQFSAGNTLSANLVARADYATTQYGIGFVAAWLARNSNNSTAMDNARRVPQALGASARYTRVDLHPFDQPILTATLQVGLIYLIIFTFQIVLGNTMAHMAVVKKIRISQYLVYRLLAQIVPYFFISLVYALLTLAFRADFSRTFGAGGFVLFWMLYWVTMMVLGLAIENVNNLVGQPLITVFLVLWIITNVIAAFFALPAFSRFYWWGYGWPLYHTVSAAKCIFFGTRNYLGLNFGVLIAWLALSIAVFPFGVLRSVSLGQQAAAAAAEEDPSKSMPLVETNIKARNAVSPTSPSSVEETDEER